LRTGQLDLGCALRRDTKSAAHAAPCLLRLQSGTCAIRGRLPPGSLPQTLLSRHAALPARLASRSHRLHSRSRDRFLAAASRRACATISNTRRRAGARWVRRDLRSSAIRASIVGAPAAGREPRSEAGPHAAAAPGARPPRSHVAARARPRGPLRPSGRGQVPRRAGGQPLGAVGVPICSPLGALRRVDHRPVGALDAGVGQPEGLRVPVLRVARKVPRAARGGAGRLLVQGPCAAVRHAHVHAERPRGRAVRGLGRGPGLGGVVGAGH
jgi:hypothetical protein